jgi:hypothetical protein
MTWYIDSWAVLDGIAFASLREPDSIKADATVFLSVPDLEPVPIGRISTALSAQRNCFQDRFCDNQGNEFAFETLTQVRETVRRGYLGGGLAPVANPVAERPIEPLLSEGVFEIPVKFPQGSGGAYYEERLQSLTTQRSLRHVQIDYSILQYPDKRKGFLESLRQKSTPELYAYVRAFGEATLLEFLHVRHNDLFKPEVRELLSQWIALLYLAGLWDTTHEFSTFLASSGLSDSIIGGSRPWTDPGSWLAANSPILSARKDSIFHVPCPLLNDWDKHIRTLHHKLLLPVVDRSYFVTNYQVPEFIPSLFCSLIIAVGPTLRAMPSSPFQAGDRYRLMGRALLWLITELPNVTLPESVEDVLTKFAWSQLRMNPLAGPEGSTPPNVRPRGNPPIVPSGSTSAPIPRPALSARKQQGRWAKS